MAIHIINQIHPTTQEIIGFGALLEKSFSAFEVIEYPLYYENFLKSITTIFQCGSAAALAAYRHRAVELKKFSTSLDACYSLLDKIEQALLSQQSFKIGTGMGMRKDNLIKTPK